MLDQELIEIEKERLRRRKLGNAQLIKELAIEKAKVAFEVENNRKLEPFYRSSDSLRDVLRLIKVNNVGSLGVVIPKKWLDANNKKSGDSIDICAMP